MNTTGILDTSAVIALPRLSSTRGLPDHPCITTVSLAELAVGPLIADDERTGRSGRPCSSFGHVRQLDSVAADLLTELAAGTPLLAGVEQVCWVDIDDTIRATSGYTKQGAGYGYSGVKGLNALLAIVSTPLSRPVIAATRLRPGRRTRRGARSGWSPTR